MHNAVLLASASGMDDIAPILILPVMFATVAFIVWVVVNNRRRRDIMQAQTEMQTKLLDKFGSAQELANYLNSEAGQKFVTSATIEQTKPYGRILGGLTAGIVILLFGLASLSLRPAMPNPDGVLVVTVTGTVSAALGLGFLLASDAAYVLSKNWGLFNGDSKHSDHE